jgi:hypothetical protein
MIWAEHVAHLGEIRNSYKILFGIYEGKRPLQRHGMDGDNIKMYLRNNV